MQKSKHSMAWHSIDCEMSIVGSLESSSGKLSQVLVSRGSQVVLAAQAGGSIIVSQAVSKEEGGSSRSSSSVVEKEESSGLKLSRKDRSS